MSEKCARAPAPHSGTITAMLFSMRSFIIRQAWRLLLHLIIAAVGFAQSAPPREKCEFDQDRAQHQVRRVAGSTPTTYYVSCQKNNPNADAAGCIKDTIKPGLVVSVNRIAGGWACISGSDSTSGWVQESILEELPAEPDIPLKMWEGWWEHPANERAKGKRNDRLLITPTEKPGSLRVSGRAYWYGRADVVHFGQVNGEATPVGKYLYLAAGRCVIDFQFASKNPPEMQVHQNEFEAGACGGMNVSFGGKWVKFTPKRGRPSTAKSLK